MGGWSFLNRLLGGNRAPAPGPRLEAFWTAAKAADWAAELEELPEARALLGTEREERLALVRQALPLLDRAGGDHATYQAAHRVLSLIERLALPTLPYAQEDFVALLRCCGTSSIDAHLDPRKPVLKALEHCFEKRSLPPALRSECEAYLARLGDRSNTAELRELKRRVRRLLEPPSERDVLELERVDAWTSALLELLAESSDADRTRWAALLAHAGSAKGAKPSKAWSNKAQALVEALSVERFAPGFCRVLERVGTSAGFPVQVPGWDREWVDGDPTLVSQRHADILKGLIWATAPLATAELVQALGDAAERCFKKVAGIGPRAPKVGNACLQALSSIKTPNAVAQLSRLQTRVKHRSSRNQVHKALGAIAEQSGTSREELEDSSVPACGLTAVGKLERRIGDFTARVEPTSARDFELGWLKPDGKAQKATPAAIKAEHAAELEALKAQLKELEQQLPAQCRRLEGLLLSQRSLRFADFQARFAQHPLLGHLTRRLIWRVEEGNLLFGFAGDVPVDLRGEAVSPPQDARVSLWHPIMSPPEIVEAWRVWLETQAITQPFKQAHRELYLLTDAERRTRTYSNRFAAHVLKQHQFSALCRERGWNYTLQGGWDSHNTPYIDLAEQQLRVEFWVEAARMNDAEMSDTGIFLHVITDQVRFSRAGEGEPLELELVPPLVFSELMRDVDLFVGVASVGNDPTWCDQGERAGFAAYWDGFAFGELGETAKTRRAALARLLPRLKIAPACTLEERFLVVRGKLRTYRIHLGSANIQMEPDNQYLCIVQDRGRREAPGNVMLPFEGDMTLSVILSKAILLASDDRIRDRTIQTQIGIEYFTN